MHHAEPDLLPHVRAGDTILWGQADGQPLSLIHALVRQRHQIGRVRIFLGISSGLEEVLKPEYSDTFDYTGYCGTGSNRKLLQGGVMQILPFHYSELARRLVDGSLRADVVFLQVSPPDEHGRFSLGMVRDYLVLALRGARTVIGEVDDSIPWTHGGPYLGVEDFDLLVTTTYQPAPPRPSIASTVESAIGRHIAGIVPDGATLQIGIGNVPDSVLAALRHHRALGVHSGAIGDGVASLIESGAITNSQKEVEPGTTIGAMAIGGPSFRKLMHRNPAIELRGVDFTHDPWVLARLERFTPINSAIEVDLTGQVNSEVAGGVYVGTVGGLSDFVRAALRTSRGMPIMALPSTARGRSRIVASLSGPVSLPHSDACVIVTEHGVADLRGLSLPARVQRMIAIADPAHREDLARHAKQLPY